MWTRGHRLACLLAAVMLALPGTALAQSAGDDQYQDPFGQDGGGSSPGSTGGGSSGSTGTGDSPASTGTSPDTSVSSDDAAPAATAPAPAPAPAPGAETAQQQLPYTGSDAGLLAAGGLLLLAGGVALRVRLRDPHH